MSLSYTTRSVIGGKFDAGLETQLELRKQALNRGNTRTTDDIKYLNANTGWVRVISSVDTLSTDTRTYSSEDAKRFILQGGTLDSYGGFDTNKSNSSYTKSTEFGYIPTAGITSFQVRSKGTFGTLRDASFNFTVNSPEDFSRLEQLYLRPGFSILLEWGHSFHISNTSKNLIPTTDLYPIDSYLRSTSDIEIEKTIQRLKEVSNSYNYDGMFGIIKNFIWNYNGYTYECQVDVVSKGEVVEAVKTSMSPFAKIKQNPSSADTKYNADEYGSALLAYLSVISSATTDVIGVSNNEKIISTLIQQDKVLTERLIRRHNEVNSPLNFLVTNRTHNFSVDNSKNKYITLRSLLILINEISLLYVNDRPLVSFVVGESNFKNTFVTFDDHFGLDLGLCILPKTVENYLGYEINNTGQTSNTDDILNIFISVNFLIEVLTNLDKQQDKDTTVTDFVLSYVMTPVQENLGNINYFDIQEDIKNGISYLHLVDRKVIPSKNDIKTKLDLVGLESEVSNLNITSKISSNLSSLIAIAAQDTYSPSSAEDLFNLQKWNTGLRDRHLYNLKVGSQGTITSNVDTQEIVSADLQRQLFDYKVKIDAVFEETLYILPDPTGLKSIHRQIMGELVRARTNSKFSNPPGLIPFELSFILKGVSGIKVGQAFTINDFFLPDRYKGKAGFIVTGVDHTVSDNRWNTEIKSQLIFI